MTMCYIALIVLLFKILKVPPTKWTVTTAALGGVFLLSFLYISMSQFQPYSPFGRLYFVTTPLAINAAGKVTKVYVHDDKKLKKGDPIFQIDPTPYQSTVDRIIPELKLANMRLEEAQKLYGKHAGSLYELEKRQQEIKSLEAELAKAQFDLDNTTVRAPDDGHLVQNRITVGTMARKFKIASLATFVPDQDNLYIAGYKQNYMRNIEVGDKGEVFFPLYPGKVFNVEVVKIWKYIEAGQLQPSSRMKSIGVPVIPQRIPVQLKITEDISAYKIPYGSAFSATVFSDKLTWLILLRRAFFTMYSWLNMVTFDSPGSSEAPAANMIGAISGSGGGG